MQALPFLLTAIPVHTWHLKQAILFDWQDGPIEGVCEFAHPLWCCYLTLFAQYSNDDADERIFRVSEIPHITSLDPIMSLLNMLGKPTTPVWIPRWIFPTMEVQDVVEKELDQMLSDRTETDLIIHTNDLCHVTGVWMLVR